MWVWVSPDEAAVVGAAAAREGMSVGAWVGETAVGRARTKQRETNLARSAGWGLSSRRELVAALVALRAEVAALRRRPVVEPDPAVPVDELLDEQPGPTFLAAETVTSCSRCCGGSTR